MRLLIKRLLILLACSIPIYVYAQDSKASVIPKLDGDFIIWHKQCKQKDNNACYFLGLSYMEGYNTAPNKQKGKELLLNTCKTNALQACLAMQYYNPILDLDSNITANSYKWNTTFIPYKKACDLGHIGSCETIAKILLAQDNNNKANNNSNNKDKLNKDNNNSHNDLNMSIKLKQEYQALNIQIINVLDKFCDTQAENSIRNPTCKTLEDFKLKFYNKATDKMPALISLCQKSLKNPNSTRMDCARVALKYNNGDGVPKDKQKAHEYFSLACEKQKEFCYYKVLDSILSED